MLRAVPADFQFALSIQQEAIQDEMKADTNPHEYDSWLDDQLNTLSREAGTADDSNVIYLFTPSELSAMYVEISEAQGASITRPTGTQAICRDLDNSSTASQRIWPTRRRRPQTISRGFRI